MTKQQWHIFLGVIFIANMISIGTLIYGIGSMNGFMEYSSIVKEYNERRNNN